MCLGNDVGCSMKGLALARLRVLEGKIWCPLLEKELEDGWTCLKCEAAELVGDLLKCGYEDKVSLVSDVSEVEGTSLTFEAEVYFWGTKPTAIKHPKYQSWIAPLTDRKLDMPPF